MHNYCDHKCPVPPERMCPYPLPDKLVQKVVEELEKKTYPNLEYLSESDTVLVKQDGKVYSYQVAELVNTILTNFRISETVPFSSISDSDLMIFEKTEGLKKTTFGGLIDFIEDLFSPEIETLSARIDNLVANPGSATENNSELIDIRVTAGGITKTTAGAAVRDQVTALNNYDTDLSNFIADGKTDFSDANLWEVGGIRSDGSLQDNVLRVRSADYMHFIGNILYYNVGVSGFLYKYSLSNGVYTFVNFTQLSSSGYGKDHKISVDNGRNIFYKICFINNASLSIPEVVHSVSVPLTHNSYITVDEKGYGDYTSIQAALDNAWDYNNNHVTILVMPGTYSRFSMVQTQADIDSNIRPTEVKTRYISIIGVNKKECIIKDDSGEYYTPPAEICTVGLIKNLTFIATHDNPPEEPENEKHKAYAVHLDYSPEGHSATPPSTYVPQNVLFEDCILISYQAPAAGIGLHQNEVIKFKNCELYSMGPTYAPGEDDYQTNYSYLTNYGGLFCHNHSHLDNITGQHLQLDNCYISSKNGDKGAWISEAKDNITWTYEADIQALKNCSYASNGVPIVISPGFTITGDSFGNNTDALNGG